MAAEEEVRGEGEGRGREKKSLLKMQAMSEWRGGAGVSGVPSSSLPPSLWRAVTFFLEGRAVLWYSGYAVAARAVATVRKCASPLPPPLTSWETLLLLLFPLREEVSI